MKRLLPIFILVLIGFAQFPVGDSPQKESSITTEIWQKFVTMQKDLNAKLSSAMVEMKQDFSSKTILIILGIAFLYGILHAAGPGHGKMLVGSYFLNSSGTWKSALKVGSTVAMTHNGVALLIGLIFGIFIRAAGPEYRNAIQHDIRIASGVMIILVGIAYFIAGFPAVRRKMRAFAERRHDILIGVLSGIIPCPVALTVILFSIFLGKLWLGLLAVLSLSIGMAATVSTFGMVAIYFRDLLARTTSKKFDTDRIASILSFIGSFGITLAGILLLLASI